MCGLLSALALFVSGPGSVRAWRVERAARVAEEPGCDLASPAQAHQLLGL